MNPQTLARIFDPFFTTKRQGAGTGLGLSVSYGIVKEHGGRIHADSLEGEGTKFVVELPIRKDDDAQLAEQTTDAQSVSSARGTGAHILVVDDEPMILDLLIDILQEGGHRPDAAANGAEACRKIEATEYDLVLTDMRMPEMSGMELYDRVLGLRPEMEGRIVFMSGDLIDSETVMFLEKTGAHAVAKPIDIPEVLRTIDEALDRLRHRTLQPA
jgi:CheY-like chemotaxis protein